MAIAVFFGTGPSSGRSPATRIISSSESLLVSWKNRGWGLMGSGDPIGVQWGEIFYAMFCFCSCIFNVFVRLYGVYVIPKWLIKVPDLLQYFLNDFGNFEKMSKSGPVDLTIMTNMSQKIQERTWNHL